MAEEVVLVEGPGLSQMERVIDTFVAPTKTFTDILRNATWWLPFVLGTVVSYLLAWGIQTKIGWSQIVDNAIQASPALQTKLTAMTPQQVALNHKIMQGSFQYSFYAAPVINLLALLIVSVILFATINFGFGAKSEFKAVFSMANYAFLPASIKAIVAGILVLAGAAPENFTVENMLGTNPGFFISTPGALKTFLTSLDVFTIWVVVLMSIGLAIVARAKRSQGFIVVVGWWLVVVIVGTGVKAIFG
ncbi:YIP1 family protein [Granulicella paludicola]|uniref:YIP1 family protein n=1 Tax=Granulicella paludicola TaxID=474951 RepID=UPI0021E0863D|nr:YIP1 family protein [Granulicella paludicola]